MESENVGYSKRKIENHAKNTLTQRIYKMGDYKQCRNGEVESTKWATLTQRIYKMSDYKQCRNGEVESTKWAKDTLTG